MTGDEMDVIELTRALVNIPSVTGAEAGVADFIARRLHELGFAVSEQTVEGRRRNILGLLAARPRVVFCTHMDTVPPFIASSEDATHVYGRGAGDAKGSLAAMILCARELKEEGGADVGLLFVVGEETDSAGAKKANDLGIDSEFTVVGEPTENKLGFGHKGLMTVEINASGKSAHSGYPHLGDSAVEKLLDVLAKIRTMDFEDDPAWGKTLVNIGKIEGGVAHNVVPESAAAIVSLRVGANWRRVAEKLVGLAGRGVDVKILSSAEPQVLFTLPGYEQAVLPYGTDIPHLARFGKKLLLGPGSGETAHTDHDRVEKGQLREAVSIYKKLARELLALKPA
jgi:acetylornithine deacetylase